MNPINNNLSLNSCPGCFSRRFCIELTDDKSELRIACMRCGHNIRMTTDLISGFSTDSWENYETRDSMYKVLTPVFAAWNTITQHGSRIWTRENRRASQLEQL